MADKKARESGRLRDADKRRVIDSVTRLKRQRRQIENLERDNFHDDPHANLVLVNKKLPQFSDTNDSPATKKKKKTRGDHFKQRFRKNFQTLLEEEQLSIRGGPNYLTAQVPPSEYPERKFCAVLLCQVFRNTSGYKVPEVDSVMSSQLVNKAPGLEV
ncbi:Zinc finger HIT domain-containing protein 1 [Branchiostoma belcheri]|nr:Zinc finger HIT domain-containing protein 1 [Branchiostoma belcheri]